MATEASADDDGAAAPAVRRARHARSARCITLSLLALWFVVSFVVPYFARALDVRVFGWSLSYWMAAQGALVVYCAIAAVYALWMNRLDRRYGPADGGESPP